MARTARFIDGLLFALALTAVALLLRWLLNPWLADRLPFVTLFGAVAASAWFAGWRSAAASMVAGAIVALHFWLAPGMPISQWGVVESLSLGAFVLTCIVIIAFAEAAHHEAFQRTRASARLRSSEDRARVTFEQAAVGIAVTDLDGVFLEVNARFAEILGYTPQELIGRTFMDLTDPADVERTRSAVEGVKAAGHGQYRLEKRYRRKDGSTVWCMVTVNLLRDHADGPMRFVGVIDDITSRVEAQEALRRSEEFTRSIVDSSRDCIKTLSLSGEILWISKAGLKAFKLETPDSIVGKSWVELWPQTERAGALEAVQRAAAGGTGHFAAAVLEDGAVSHWSVVITPILDLQGKPERLLAVSRDLSELRRADMAVKEERRILETLNRTGATLASQLDLEVIVQSVVDAGRELSGAAFGAFFYNVTDERGDALQLYALSGAPKEAFAKFPFPRATALFGPTFRGEGILRIPDVLKDPRYARTGSGMPAGHLPVRSYLAVPVASRSGEVLGGLFFGHDQVGVFDERAERLVAGLAAQAAIAIDNSRLYEDAQRAAQERQRLLESERAARSRAEKLNAAKDDFLAILSHELRTPLGAILGWAQILRSPSVGVEHLREGLETIERNARAQTQLIDDLLDMSRIASGKVQLERARVAPRRFVEAAVETVRPSAIAKGISLHLDMDAELPVLEADATRLQQVIWNLLNNAIKFTPAGGEVSVRVQRSEAGLEVTVRDNGIGIEPALLPQVFDRFWQADTSRSRRYGGLGLGLAISKQIVEAHGGRIEVASDGPGTGATFTVRLGASAMADAGALAASRPAAAARDFVTSDLSNVSILVVDDDADARQLISRVLVECRAQVKTAASAREALDALAEFKPELLISDIGMPGMDGYEFIRRVREQGRGQDLPAIALSAFARVEDRQDAMKAGFAVHLSKPVDPVELVAVAARMMGAGESGRSNRN